MEEANKYFSDKNINLRKTWLSQAIKFYNKEKLSENMMDFLIQNWLLSDIKESSIPKSLPMLKNKGGHFLANHVFQINSVKRIDVSFHSQYINLTEGKVDLSFFYGNNFETRDDKNELELKTTDNIPKTRCLMFELFDGKNIYFGIENEVIDYFSISTPPGTKVHIVGLVAYQKKILYLNKSSVVFLGGEVKSLCEHNNILNILKRELKLISTKPSLCLLKTVSTNLSNDQIDEYRTDKKTSQNNEQNKNNANITKEHNYKDMGTKIEESIEDITNDGASTSCSSFGYLEPLETPNLNECLLQHGPETEKNTNTSENLITITGETQTSVLEKSQQDQYSMQNLRRISLTKDSENILQCGSQNSSSRCQQATNKSVSSTCKSVFDCNDSKSLALLAPKNLGESSNLDTNHKTDISNYDNKGNMLKRQSNEIRDFFDTSISDFKKIKKHNSEEVSPSERIVSIQKAKELASISFAAYHAKVKGEVIKIIDELSVEDNLWTMKILIMDSSETSLECLIDNMVIQEFLGMTAEEGLRLRKSNFTKQKENAKNRLQCLLGRLKLKDLVFSINIFESSIITPVIVKIQTFKQFTHKIY